MMSSNDAVLAGAPQSLSMDIDSGDNSNPENEETMEDANATPLDQKIMELVTSSDNKDPDRRGFFTIRPARLSAELGISVEDATAELCGLLAACGGGHDGASFAFETVSTKSKSSTMTMVFSFPPDVQKRAFGNRRKEDFKQWCWQMLGVAFRALKILTAFGLILSLCILTIAAMIAIVAGIVAMSTQQNNNNSHHHRNIMLRQLRTLFFTMRQLLWMHALFGHHVEGQDPFMSELSYDMFLLSSVCCVNPGSFFWWYRVSQLNRRRRRARRGWGGRGLFGSRNDTSGDAWNANNEMESEVEGVRLIRRGEWGQEEQPQQASVDSDHHRGLLSIAVEYLFGPTPFQPGPIEADVWKLRAAAIVQISADNAAGANATPGVSLHQLSAYMDNPPASLEDSATIVKEGLLTVSHFNGVPASDAASTDTAAPHEARFLFPELLAESQFATRYDESLQNEVDDAATSTWGAFLCARNQPNALTRTPMRTGDCATVPTYLREKPFKFTELGTDQFTYCVFLGILNLVGVIWLRSSLNPPNGILQIQDGTWLATIIKHGLMKVLYFYAILFFALPAGRLLLIVFFNSRRTRRNRKRKELASSGTNQETSAPSSPAH